MGVWDRRATYLCAALLVLMAVGHGANFLDASQTVTKAGVDETIAEAIRVVWITISGMLVLFGFLLARQALSKTVADWIVISSIGCLVSASGVAGLIISAGKPFWWQQVVIGLAIAALGWRARTNRSRA
jgi:cytochrome bd-type quinol oxidase subunit 2